MTVEDAYAALIEGRRGVHRTPSRGFLAVLRTLAHLDGRSSNYRISKVAAIQEQETARHLGRMIDFGLVEQGREEITRHGVRIPFQLTEAGWAMAKLPPGPRTSAYDYYDEETA